MNSYPELYVLEVRYGFNGKEEALYPVVLRAGGETILVDCGYARMIPLIEEAMKVHDLALKDLTGIIITHHDIDHLGSLAEIRRTCPAVRVYASTLEKPYIEGSKKSLRLQQAEDLYPCLPKEEKQWAANFQQLLKSVQPVAVDTILPLDGAISFLAGVRVTHTPGHMPGHLSLYLPEQKTLVSADAVVYENGALAIANPQYTLDLPAALASVRKLRDLDIDTIVCYHGGVVKGDIRQQLSELLSRYDPNAGQVTH